jgi:MFS transporter, BCD family, chlorophyll transporter
MTERGRASVQRSATRSSSARAACAGTAARSRSTSTSRRAAAAARARPRARVAAGAEPLHDRRWTTAARHRWGPIAPRFLPFADAATPDLPLSRLLRPVAVPGLGGHGAGAAGRHAEPRDDRRAGRAGLAGGGDGGAAGAVRAVARADRLSLRHHRSALGWRRVPFIWMGTMLQFGGLAIMPFALLVLSGRRQCRAVAGVAGPGRRGLAFLLVGAGLHTVQTAGLALATDLAPARSPAQGGGPDVRDAAAGHHRQRLVFGAVLADFSPGGWCR